MSWIFNPFTGKFDYYEPMFGNIDGGTPDTDYSGLYSIDGGGP